MNCPRLITVTLTDGTECRYENDTQHMGYVTFASQGDDHSTARGQVFVPRYKPDGGETYAYSHGSPGWREAVDRLEAVGCR